MTDERFAVLIVCHANMCRSPMAERLARRTIIGRMGATGTGFEVSSAGTHAWTGRPMHPLAAEVLREYGADDTGFKTRRLTADLVADADLVLTATRQQRAECVGMAPTAVHHTFTLPQFGRVSAAIPKYSLTAIWPPQARLRALIEELHVVRGTLQVATAEEDELPDPVEQPINVFRRCAGEIQWVLDVMMGLIAPT